MRVGDRTALTLVRRGKRAGLTVEVHQYVHAHGGWTRTMVGPSSSFDEPTLPARATATAWSVYSCAATQGPLGLWQLVADAAWISFGDHRHPVPSHGWVATIEVTSKEPAAVLDAAGETIGQLNLRDLRPRGMRFWARLMLGRMARRDGWWNRTPRVRASRSRR